VSKNDNCHGGKSHGKERLKRKALRRPRKADIEGVDVTCWEGQTTVPSTESLRTAATGNDEILWIWTCTVGKGQNPLHQFPRSKSATNWQLMRLKGKLRETCV